jgi:hypothetical protein
MKTTTGGLLLLLASLVPLSSSLYLRETPNNLTDAGVELLFKRAIDVCPGKLSPHQLLPYFVYPQSLVVSSSVSSSASSTARPSTTAPPPCPTAPLSCEASGCSGTFNADGNPVCASGCRCIPTAGTCGTPASCDANGCNGSFDGNGIATCKGRRATCRCTATAANCGERQLCRPVLRERAVCTLHQLVAGLRLQRHA